MRSVRTCSARWLACATAVLLVGVATPEVARAQGNSANISGNLGVDFSNAYFYRGIRQEREGLVLQPYADVSFSLFEKGDQEALHSVNFTLGLWNSLHTGPTGSQAGGAATHVRSWYESDFFTGFTLGIDNWEAGITYTSYMSPNDSFSTISEMSFSLAMDDSTLFGSFAMNPHVVLAVELNGQADGGASEGVYLEAGVEPGMDLADGAASISFPVTFGFSMSNYYENGAPAEGPVFSDTFGYFDVGGVLVFPLEVMPEGYGDWELSGGFHLLSLGSYLEALNDADGVQAIGIFGVNLGF